jgi:PAS domain S-box-containing protein
MPKRMDISLIKVRGFNAVLYLLVGVQLAALAGIVAFLISFFSHGSVSIMTAFSSMFILILGLPLLYMLYRSNDDPVLKRILMALLASFSMLTISGITLYVLSDYLGQHWLVPVSQFIMVFSYLPIIYVLYGMIKSDKGKISPYLKAFIVFVNAACILSILYFAITGYNGAHSFRVGIYSASTILDIFLLAMYAIVIAAYTPTKVRYIISIGFAVAFLSFLHDTTSLMSYLGISSVSAYPEYIYNMMLVVLVGGLLIYSLLSNIRSTTVEEVNKKLDDTRQIMEDIIMQSPDAICVFSPEGDMLLNNGPMEEFFGRDSSSLIGNFNLFKHLIDKDTNENIHRIKQGETVMLGPIKISPRNAPLIYLSVKIFPTHDSSGSITSIVSMLENVTARIQAEEELKQAKALVELYIDLMGHDINNMNQMGMGYLEIALDTMVVNDDTKKLLIKPFEAMESSSRLIDNVKKLRRISAGDMGLQLVDLGKILNDVVKENGQAPGREVAIEYSAGENTFIYANELLKDVFVNLLNNSIKHSTGPLKISIIQDTIEKAGKKYYRVILEDNGPGIPGEIQPIIFDRVERGRKKVGGKGIGLYLVKALIDHFGGTITVEDRISGDRKNGSRFIVTLPAAVT